MIRVGVIGLGFMGRAHLACYARMPGAIPVAIADSDGERRRPDFNPGGNLALSSGTLDWTKLRILASSEELIQDPDVDVVDICLPTFLHARYAVMALEHGKHVICEKPMALTVTEADQMLAAARAADRRLYIAQVVRFWPEFTILRQLVASGELGRFKFLFLSRQSAPSTWQWKSWSADVSQSGGVIDVAIHDIDYAQFLLGLPQKVYAQCVGERTILHAQYEYEQGTKVVVHSNKALAPGIGFEARFEAVFEGGMVRYLSSQKPTLAVYRGADKTPEHPRVEGDAYYEELCAFLDCIRTGSDGGALVDPVSARESLRLAEASFTSAEIGIPVNIT